MQKKFIGKTGKAGIIILAILCLLQLRILFISEYYGAFYAMIACSPLYLIPYAFIGYHINKCELKK
jgi:hypothetical protein